MGLDPDCVEARLNLATLLEEDGFNGAALRHYKIALRGEPPHLLPDPLGQVDRGIESVGGKTGSTADPVDGVVTGHSH